MFQYFNYISKYKKSCHQTLKYLTQASNSSLSKIAIESKVETVETVKNTSTEVRTNEVGIQMISEQLRSYLFGEQFQKSKKDIEKSHEHLKKFDLLNKNSDVIADLTSKLKLPKLYGKNIDEHFRYIAHKSIDKYVHIISKLANCENMPQMPKKFNWAPGWTRYDSNNNTFEIVDFPKDEVLVFDVEVLMSDGHVPTMAVALSDKAWYSWCSDRLINDTFQHIHFITADDLIPLETPFKSNKIENFGERIIVCHNAGFDRSFVKEQYFLQKSKLRFLDTMSMHIACNGFTSEQRTLSNAMKDESAETEIVNSLMNAKYKGNSIRQNQIPIFKNFKWKKSGSLNNLHDVHKLYCPNSERLNKELRNVFVDGKMEDIRKDFQNLMAYCANDVKATFEVLKELFPVFLDRFPHPVTMNGMLEMGTMQLPINKNWVRYIDNCKSVYDDLQHIAKNALIQSADEACQFIHNDRYKEDPWLYDLDWSVSSLTLKKETNPKRSKIPESKEPKTESSVTNDLMKQNPLFKILSEKEKYQITEKRLELSEATIKVIKTSSRLPKNLRHLYNYPNWYRELCEKDDELLEKVGENNISIKTRITPKLLRLTWNGFPMFHTIEQGWGYLVPRADINEEECNKKDKIKFPYAKLKEICNFENVIKQKPTKFAAELSNIAEEIKKVEENIMKASENLGTQRLITKLVKKKKDLQDKAKKLKEKCPYHDGNGPYEDENVPSGCYFFRIPHKDGNDLRVGNPLSKSFISKLKEGVLSSYQGHYADLLLKCQANKHYWENNEKRISGQSTVWQTDINNKLRTNQDYYGIILPKTIVSGTITRRAVEPTWLTASNYEKDRIGSELKAMIQCPEGYHFVGADVDSQELWIASAIGDANFAKIHGSTAIGWMTLQGKKKDNTDMHSKVANMIGISRDHAKVFNYGRIYGAGRQFAEKLLLQFNPNLDVVEAHEKAMLMYDMTKGKKDTRNDKWVGGSESEMFNKLEAIAKSKLPKTPVLNASITECLEPENVSSDFMTSRINWVVQSSAVDYLHVMLVCMQWLIDEYKINARFSISIHDEVRFIVKSEDRYRAALALQITNLLTRALFSYKLGFDDLPLQIAFFSEVDIDRCLRKDTHLEFITPSNPFGLTKGHGIPAGESFDINKLIDITNGDLNFVVEKNKF